MHAAAGYVDNGPGVGHDPLHLTASVLEVNGELPSVDAVHLLRRMTVEARWPAAGAHVDLDGEHGAPGLTAAHPNPDLVTANSHACLSLAKLDKLLVGFSDRVGK